MVSILADIEAFFSAILADIENRHPTVTSLAPPSATPPTTPLGTATTTPTAVAPSGQVQIQVKVLS